MIRELDLQVGRLIKQLKAVGEYENTLFVFSSDNGGLNIAETEAAGHDSSNGYRGFKTYIYEGGHRVPFIASWPAQIQAGVERPEPVMVHDIMATLFALTGQPMAPQHALDSYNLLPLLLQQPGAKGRDIIISQGSGKRGTLAIRKGDWKLIIQSERNRPDLRLPIELYHLKHNPLEKADQNLIHDPDQQERVQELLQAFHQIRDASGRTTPLVGG